MFEKSSVVIPSNISFAIHFLSALLLLQLFVYTLPDMVIYFKCSMYVFVE